MLHWKQRKELVGRVVADGVCRAHHDAGILQDLIAGTIDEYAVEHDGGDQKSHRESRQNNEIEFGSQAHYFGSSDADGKRQTPGCL